jgi:hypothetical protein
LKNFVAGLLYFAGAHAFDALYAIASNKLSYLSAIGSMFIVLAVVSGVLVAIHAETMQRTGWDVLGLDRLNKLRDEKDIPKSSPKRRFTRWCMRRRLAIFTLGSCILGPPVVTILLRKPGSLPDSMFYTFSGTLISVVVWVTAWKGIWSVWIIYIKPVIHGAV